MQQASAVNKPKLVLASGSPRRVMLLHQIGIDPDHLHPADINESPKQGEHPLALAKRLAAAKAEKSAAFMHTMPEFSQALVLAADTVVSVGRTILPKPDGEDEALECLKLLSGRTHKVYTALCLVNAKGKSSKKVVETRVRFARLSRKIMDSYLASLEWRGKAGGYAIQGLAGSFVTQLVGSYSNVVGLPLNETMELLSAQRYPVLDSWAKGTI